MCNTYRHAFALASSRQASDDRGEIIARGDLVLAIVADGAGGLRGGATASDALVEAAKTRTLDAACDPFDTESWLRFFREVDATLSARMTGETTGVIAVLGPQGLLGVSAGDSEAWVISATSIDDLTGAQSKLRLGSGRAGPVSFQRPRLEGTLLVGTDGLFKYVSAETIAALVRAHPVEESPRRLVDAARLRSGRLPDDIAVFVCASSAS